ncbi:MAG: Hsp20 family protein [Rhodocyclaceae bacterium]|nr:Hsp20 family protein [Rhodocyclaceae bacterium]
MRQYDLSPLYRSAIGFDRLANLVDNALRSDAQPSYPPYNVERIDENNYLITMAVAGFTRAEIDIEVENDTLKIVGSKQKIEPAKTYLHRGIGTRDFEHRFQLAEHVKVVSAALDNGLLSISLEREIPETMKPRKISISGDEITQVPERKAA